ncbi:unnamed protein product [Meloidogyne enterolobii]|uniref:Uncharacterized protein n=1 Tax=Meloidogyne enterolobii TaxID=390850 RepID=A0ACB0YQ83_MELEN
MFYVLTHYVCLKVYVVSMFYDVFCVSKTYLDVLLICIILPRKHVRNSFRKKNKTC